MDPDDIKHKITAKSFWINFHVTEMAPNIMYEGFHFVMVLYSRHLILKYYRGVKNYNMNVIIVQKGIWKESGF